MDKQVEKEVAARLEKIAKANGGRVTPDAVVEDAKNPRSPLHAHFEWDDSVAAHQHRLRQARDLIRAVPIKHSITTSFVAPKYVRDPKAESGEQGYRELVSIRDERESALEVLDAEMRRIVSAIERAMAIAEILGLTEELQLLLDRVEGLRTRRAA